MASRTSDNSTPRTASQLRIDAHASASRKAWGNLQAMTAAVTGHGSDHMVAIQPMIHRSNVSAASAAPAAAPAPGNR